MYMQKVEAVTDFFSWAPKSLPMVTIAMKLGFPGSSVSKESACNAGDAGSTPGLGKFPGEGNGTPLQYPCQENPMDRGAWRATDHNLAKSRTQLSD